MKPIAPHKTQKRGETRWRVIIPLALADGKRRVRLFRTRELAQAFAADLEAQRGGDSLRLIRLSEGDKGHMVRALHAVGDKAADVEKAAVTYAAQNLVTMPVQDAIAACLSEKAASGLRPRSMQSLRSTLGQFSRTVSGDVASVTPDDVSRFALSSGVGDWARRGRWIDLHTFFSFCLARRWCATNPVEAIPRPKVEHRPPCILSPEEGRKLFDACREVDPRLLPYLAICAFGGLRPENEAASVEWEHVNWACETGTVAVQGSSSKTRRRRLVPLNPTLRGWISLGGDLPPVNLKRRLLKVRAAAGIPWGRDCLRHSCASYAVPIWGAATVAGWLGHSEAILHQHYRELVTEADAKEWWNILP